MPPSANTKSSVRTVTKDFFICGSYLIRLGPLAWNSLFLVQLNSPSTSFTWISIRHTSPVLVQSKGGHIVISDTQKSLHAYIKLKNKNSMSGQNSISSMYTQLSLIYQSINSLTLQSKDTEKLKELRKIIYQSVVYSKLSLKELSIKGKGWKNISNTWDQEARNLQNGLQAKIAKRQFILSKRLTNKYHNTKHISTKFCYTQFHKGILMEIKTQINRY